MKQLTNEQKAYVDTLNTVANEITQRILTATDANGEPKYLHMIDMWKAFLGGFVCTELAELQEVTDEQKELLEAYTPDKIKALFEPKIFEKEVIKEVIKEVEVVKEVKVNVPAPAPVATGSTPAPAQTFRRRFHSVNRPKEKVRDLLPGERQYMIEKFNTLQRLIDRNSTECGEFVTYLNGVSGLTQQVYASQLAGYWSVLCKRVCGIDGDVNSYYDSAVKRGKLSVGCPKPVASDEFKKAILENLIASKEEAARVTEYQNIYRNLMASNPNLKSNI